jgi:serine acetyltransferase
MNHVNEINIVNTLNYWFEKSILKNDLVYNFDLNKIALQNFELDYRRYFPEAKLIEIEKLESRLELVGILLYRLARTYYLENSINEAEKFSLLGRFLAGFEIYYSAEIGHSLKINHGLGTVIGARVKIGNNALIHQGVTFGDKNGKRPVIKNNVCIYAGAKIIGEIIIDDNSIIGANCVCMINVPKNSIIAGVPGKIIKK